VTLLRTGDPALGFRPVLDAVDVLFAFDMVPPLGLRSM
jgi:hypothetical protein